jgi:hypothetical protein
VVQVGCPAAPRRHRPRMHAISVPEPRPLCSPVTGPAPDQLAAQGPGLPPPPGPTAPPTTPHSAPPEDPIANALVTALSVRHKRTSVRARWASIAQNESK